MLSAAQIKRLFSELNVELRKTGVQGEIGICGGAVMCLVFEARRATKDVDAIFHPTKEIRDAARAVARRRKLPDDWLNDAAKGFFLREPPRDQVLELSNLRVWAPRADYMLAMKAVSARFDSSDADDVRFLIRWLGLKGASETLTIIERYYPRHRIPARTHFFIEEIFDKQP